MLDLNKIRRQFREEGYYDVTNRPWIYLFFAISGFFFMPFINLIFFFLGHTYYYKFDNNTKQMTYCRYRGFCCFNLQRVEEEHHYNEIEKIYITPDKSLNVILKDGNMLELHATGGNQWYMLLQGNLINELTNIPLQRDASFPSHRGPKGGP
eukprot:gb/GECH01012337.1/.p1 GENE.gb/GECH01012337.1/~~gb/GECH01012337.1/.p1  ORF type:complete len:152 (+),score=18.00 gb/GECH01012337.1/:1-456(+)